MSALVEVLVADKACGTVADLGIKYRLGTMSLQGYLVMRVSRDDAPSLIKLLGECGYKAFYNK